MLGGRKWGEVRKGARKRESESEREGGRETVSIFQFRYPAQNPENCLALFFSPLQVHGTPLQAAAAAGHYKALKLLVEDKADLQIYFPVPVRRIVLSVKRGSLFENKNSTEQNVKL